MNVKAHTSQYNNRLSLNFPYKLQSYHNSPQKLLEDTGDGVNGVVVHVDQAARLQEVDELLHGALVPRRAEHVAAQRGLLVQLQD